MTDVRVPALIRLPHVPLPGDTLRQFQLLLDVHDAHAPGFPCLLTTGMRFPFSP